MQSAAAQALGAQGLGQLLQKLLLRRDGRLHHDHLVGARLEPGQSRRALRGFLKPAQLVDQPRGQSRSGAQHPPFGHGVGLGSIQAPAGHNQGEKPLIDAVHGLLQGALDLRDQGAVHAQTAGEGRGADAIGVHPAALQEVFEGGKGGKHADTARQRARRGHDMLGRGGHVVAPRGGNAAHAGHDRYALLADIGHGLAHDFRGEHAAAAAGQTQHDSAQAVLFGRVPQQPGDRVAPDHPQGLGAGHDIALGCDHRDVRLSRLQGWACGPPVLQIVGKGHRGVGAVLVLRAHQSDEISLLLSAIE